MAVRRERTSRGFEQAVARGKRWHVRAPAGFSMIELLVVIGVVLVLVGLIVPVIGRSVEAARTSADLATIRQNASLVMQHAGQEQGVYPLVGASRCSAGSDWYKPLVASGLLVQDGDADPRSFGRWGEITFHLSESLVAIPAEFTWGTTRPCRESPASPVTDSLVSFPSAKGMLWKTHDAAWEIPTEGRIPHGSVRAFCCIDPWVAPVAFCDGSATTGTYLDFSFGQQPVVNWSHRVGIPIATPWRGYLARER